MHLRVYAHFLSKVVVLLLFSVQSKALPKVCDILFDHEQIKLIQSQTKSSDEIDSFVEQLSAECSLQTRFEKLKLTAQGHGLDAEKISEYYGLRFIYIGEYEWARMEDISVPYIYQQSRADSRLPKGQRGRLVWDNWVKGLTTMDESVEFVEKWGFLNLDRIKHVHKMFYDLSEDVGETEHDPKKGEFKNCSQCSYLDFPWWTFGSEEEADKFYEVTTAVNAELRAMKLLPYTSLKDADGELLNWVYKTDGEIIYSAAPRMVFSHMLKWKEFFTRYYKVIKSGYKEKLESHEKLMTPLQFASMMQQWMVMVHPFQDGNGRNSRYWHDLIMQEVGLPFAPAGKLSNDLEYTFDEYADLVTAEITTTLGNMEACMTDPILADTALSFDEKQAALPYDCRQVD